MKKYVCILVSLLMSFSLCSCGNAIEVSENLKDKNDTEVETEVTTEETVDLELDATPQDAVESTEETTEEAVATPLDGNDDETPLTEMDKEIKAAYAYVLWDMYNNHVMPGGEDVNDEINEFSDIEENEFAVYDIDGDGQVELDIKLTSASMAGMREKIYSYNDYTGELEVEFFEFPACRYYEGGFIQADISHNQGLAGDFWPYTLYQYNQETDRYDGIAYLDAWDHNYFEKDYDDNPFPSEYDVDGDGLIYYISDENNNGEGVTPVDGPEKDAWLKEKMGDAKELDIPFRHLSDIAITEYETSEFRTSKLDMNKYTEYTLKDLVFYVPKLFEEKGVRAETSEDGNAITFYYPRSEEIMSQIYGFDATCTLFTVMAYEGSDYYELPSYKYLGNIYDDNLSYDEQIYYVALFPTDVQCVSRFDYDKAVESGIDITEEELDEINTEYGELFKYSKDLNEKLKEY